MNEERVKNSWVVRLMKEIKGWVKGELASLVLGPKPITFYSAIWIHEMNSMEEATQEERRTTPFHSTKIKR